MQKKQYETKAVKRITALLMSGILLMTSMPLMMRTAAGEPTATDGVWSPEPYFSEAAKEEGATAWFQNDGTVAIQFPKATGGEQSYQAQNKKKTIKNYLIEIYALGKKSIDPTNLAEETPTLLYRNMVPADATVSTMAAGDGVAMLYAGLTQEELKQEPERLPGTLDKPITRDSAYRLNVRITAVDEQNWFSEPMDALITDVPYFDYVAEKYEPIDERNENAIRDITTYEVQEFKDKDTKQNRNDTLVLFEGNSQVQYHPKQPLVADVGAPDKDGHPSKAMGFRIDEKITNAPKRTTFDSSLSRECWDLTGTEELWFWFDCSEVCLQDVSFRLRYNEKLMWVYKKDGSFEAGSGSTIDRRECNRMSRTVYSTMGFPYASVGPDGIYKTEQEKKDAAYVTLQREDGGWEKVPLSENGTVTLDHFKGYVRVPMELFCAEEDVTVNMLTNTGSGNGFKPYIEDPQTGRIAEDTKSVLTAKGTPMSKGYLTQKITCWRSNSGKATDQEGYAPAFYVRDKSFDKNRQVAYDRTSQKFVCDESQNYNDLNAGMQKQGGMKAIEDIFSAGFEIGGCTDDSVKHSFFFDNVLAYKKPIVAQDGTIKNNPFPNDKLTTDAPNKTGAPLKHYYNQKLDRAAVVLDAIDKYIFEPSWTEFREVEYIHKMIEGFAQSFGEPHNPKPVPPQDPDVFIDNEANQQDIEGMAWAAKKLGRLKTWEKYREAFEQCVVGGTIVKNADGTYSILSNADTKELVPEMITIMESLPKAEWLVNPTPDQQKQLVKLYQAYTTLNLGQLESLGEKEAEELFEYAKILGKSLTAKQDDYIVGEVLAENPYLPFCNFDTLPVNAQAMHVEDDKRAFEDTLDIRLENGFITSSMPSNVFAGYMLGKGDEVHKAYSTDSGYDLRIHGSSASIVNKGYLLSQAAQLTINMCPRKNSGGMDRGIYPDMATFTVSKDAKSHSTPDAFRGSGGCGVNGYHIGALAKKYSSANEAKQPPLSLVFYVDFSELKDVNDFMFGTAIFTKDGSGADKKFTPSMGSSPQDQKYFVLDTDPASASEGTWLQAAGGNERFFKANTGITRPMKDGTEKELSLSGYKGYIRVPLYHFQYDKTQKKLDQYADDLNNIYAIRFGFSTFAPENFEKIQGKSIVIDNIGFTYSAEAYSDVIPNLTPAEKALHKSYEEVYSAKSNTAYNFEKAVAEIDIYGDEIAFQNAVTAARAQHTALTDYQKTLPSVKRAEARLLQMEGWKTNPNTKLKPINPFYQDASGQYTSLKDLKNKIDNSAAHTQVEELDLATIEGFIKTPNSAIFPNQAMIYDEKLLQYDPREGAEQKVRYPGFVNKDVNYAAFGFKDREHVERILMVFEYAIPRLSKADQNSLTTTYQNEIRRIYNAAVRCRELAKTKDAVMDICFGKPVGTYDPLSGMEPVRDNQGIYSAFKDYPYTPECSAESEAQPTFATIANRTDIENTYKTIYETAPYFAKVATKNGSVIPELNNVSESIKLFLINSQTYNLSGASPIDAGLISLETEYKALLDELDIALHGNQLIEDGLWKKVQGAIEDYDHLLPRFKNVGELFTPIEHIKRKFPIVNTVATPSTMLNLTDKKLAAEEVNSYTVTYAVDIPASRPGKKNVLAFIPTSATPQTLAGQEYTLTFDFGDGSPVTFDSSTFINGQAVKIKEITPNVYGNNGTTQNSLAVKVTCTLKTTPAEDVFADQSSFTLGVMTETTEGGTTTLSAYEPAKNTTYTSTVQEKAYTLQYSKDDTFEVSFPAETKIAWGETSAASVGYTVTTNMHAGASLKVKVEDKKGEGAENQKLLLNGTNPAMFLTYTAAGFDIETTFTGTQTDAKATPPATMTVDYTDKPLGDYSTTLTYTVTYNDGTAVTPPTP